MAMSEAGLKAEIKSSLLAVFGAAEDDEKLDDFCQAMADAIVGYIQANAVVTGTVTTGMGAGGAVTGTVG